MGKIIIKGDYVGYAGIHAWVKRYKPKQKFCEKCKRHLKLDLSNISGKYKRDINDFEWLCRKCHEEKDGNIHNLKQFNGIKMEKKNLRIL